MSHTIIYDKQFIKVKEDLFVPMTLAGANNCTQMSPSGREMRERSWSGWFWSDGVLFSEAQMLELIAEDRKEVVERNDNRERDKWFDEYSDDRYGYWVGLAIGGTTHSTSFAKYQSFIKTGCKKALTVEQLADSGVSVWVSTPWVWDGIEKVHGLKPFGRKAKSGEDFVELYELMVEYLKGTDLKPSIRFEGMNDDKPTRLRKWYFPQAKKDVTGVGVKEFWSIGMFYEDDIQRGYDNPRYFFKKFTSRHCHYLSQPAHKFLTEKDAIAKCKRANGRKRGFPFQLKPWKVVAENEVTVFA